MVAIEPKQRIRTNSQKVKPIFFNDFKKGLVTTLGALAYQPDMALNLLNVIPFEGRLQYVGGWSLFGIIIGKPDAIYGFQDSNKTRHIVVWSNGNVADFVNGSPITIENGAYVPGQMIGAADDNGILYWSTVTVPIRFWNPTLGTHGAVAQTGTSPVPASPILIVYSGSLVAFGVQFGASAYQPNVFSWSAVGDFGNWNAINSQAVGPNNGASIAFGQQFGASAYGISPFELIVVGRTDKGIYGYQGALGSLHEILTNCPVGCLDGASLQYVPAVDGFGTFVFLGTDGQFWKTNGVSAVSISDDILTVLAPAVIAQLQNNPNARFYSGYNEKWQYYFCSVGSNQYLWKWKNNGWSVLSGWPIGPTILYPNTLNVPTLFTAGTVSLGPATAFIMGSATQGILGTNRIGLNSSYALATVAIDQANMNGSPPVIYYQSPWIHSGDIDLIKWYESVAIQTYNTGTNYQVTAQTLPRADGTQLNSVPLQFPAPPTVGQNNNAFILDQSLLNGPNVLTSIPSTVVGSGIPVINRGRLAASIVMTGVLTGRTRAAPIIGKALSVTVAYNGGTPDFELLGIELLARGKDRFRDGGSKFTAQGGISTGSIYLRGRA